MPYASGLTYRDGARIVYDPADYPAAFDEVLRRLDYARWREEQARRRGTTRPIGIGLSAYVEGTGLGPFEGADVRVDPGGTVFVHVGVSAQGQAHETTLAQICADQLDVPIERVVVKGGDTQLVGYGMGTIASRVAAVAGPAVARSAAEVARKAKVVAAELFECAPDDVELAGGRVFVKGVPDRSLSLGTVAQAAVRSLALARRGRPGALPLRVLLSRDRHVGIRGAGRSSSRWTSRRAWSGCSTMSPCTTRAVPSTRWSWRDSSTAAWCRGSAAR